MNIERCFNKIIKYVFSLTFFWIILLNVFIAGSINYFYKKTFLVPNYLIFTITALLFFAIYKSRSKERCVELDKKVNYNKIVNVMVVVIFFVQVYIFYLAFFETGWDVGGDIIPAARYIGLNTKGYEINKLDYFSMYPNNKLLVSLYAAVLKFNSLFGFFSGNYELMCLVVLNCFSSSLASYFVYKVGEKIMDEKYAFICYVFSVFLFVFSPWNIITYSDALGIFIPVLMMYVYLNEKISIVVKWSILSFLTYFGYCLKPQLIFVSIAVCGVEFLKMFDRSSCEFRKEDIYKKAVAVICMVLVVFTLNFSLNKIYIFEGFESDTEKNIGIAHYLKMGSNYERTGGYLYDDVVFSVGITSKAERNNRNLEIYRNRVKQYGAVGYIKFLSKKMIVNYNDGTFAWGVEGGFFKGIKPEISILSKIVRSFYYGRLHKFWAAAMQIVWMSILSMVFISSVYMVLKKDKEKIDYTYILMCLTILGLTVFELLFESRARYLYSNLPIYILLAVYGMYNIFNNSDKKKQ